MRKTDLPMAVAFQNQEKPLASVRKGVRRLLRHSVRPIFAATASAVLSCGLGVVVSTALAQPAVARSITYNLDIPAQSLNDALQALALASQHKLLYSAEVVEGKVSVAVKGNLTTDEAVRQMLSGTSLNYEVTGDGLVLIRSENEVSRNQKDSKSSISRLGDGSSRPIRLSQSETQGSKQSDSTEGVKLEEIVVTAQKRAERLQDVPVPVTAIRADALVSTNQLRLQDYYTKVPGLSLTLLGDGAEPTLAIRGITTGGSTNPTVGVVIDDVSYGSSINLGTTPSVADIDPSELERVEVLRGPQGTLYGASSIGGLLKFVTIDPSTSGFSGRVQGGITSVRNGDGLGYNMRGAVNLPLGDSFAVRASAFDVSDAGYVDNVQTRERGVNNRDSSGGRLSALWRPSDAFSLKLSALFQQSTRHGSDEVHLEPGLNDLEQSALLGTGRYERTTQAYSATMNAKIGGVNLVSATGYSVDKDDTTLDTTLAYGGLADLSFGVTGANNAFQGRYEKFTQEIRMSVPIGQRLEWLSGVFYTRESLTLHLDILAEDPHTGVVAGEVLTIDLPGRFDEYAAFTNLTFDVTDRFDIQFGGRFSENKPSFYTVRSGALAELIFGSDPSIVPKATSKDSAFTYLVTPRFKVSPDLMIYARLASGYRPGGPNSTCTFTFPCEYSADKTENFELGFKGDLLDRRLSVDASVYYIDWKDIQLSLVDPAQGLGYVDNGGRAKSQGVDLSVEFRPSPGLTVSTWASYNDAKLTEDPPLGSFLARSGDRLPYSSPFSASISLDQEFPMMVDMTGFIGGSVSYVDDREGSFAGFFNASPMRQKLPSYTQTDLRAGLRYDSWVFNVFVNNLTDKRGVLSGGLDKDINGRAFNYIQPRTVGMSILKTFQ